MQNVQFLDDVEFQCSDNYGDPVYWALLGITPELSKVIETCARVCYRSEGKMKENSSDALFAKLSKSGHYSTFEHSNIVIAIKDSDRYIADNIIELISCYPLITVVPMYLQDMYILKLNARTVVEMFDDNMSNTWVGCHLMNNPILPVMLNLRKFLPVKMFDKFVIDEHWTVTEEKDKEYINNVPNVQVVHIDNFPWQNSLVKPQAEKLAVATLIVDMNRQISHQFVRHRMSSYSQESQRYVDLSDRFDYMVSDKNISSTVFDVYPDSICGCMSKIQMSYNDMMRLESIFYKSIREAGFKPEVARGVLPNDCKTRIAVTRTIEQWRHYFGLRIEKHAQSLHQELAKNMLEAIQKNSYWLVDLKGE